MVFSSHSLHIRCEQVEVTSHAFTHLALMFERGVRWIGRGESAIPISRQLGGWAGCAVSAMRLCDFIHHLSRVNGNLKKFQTDRTQGWKLAVDFTGIAYGSLLAGGVLYQTRSYFLPIELADSPLLRSMGEGVVVPRRLAFLCHLGSLVLHENHKIGGQGERWYGIPWGNSHHHYAMKGAFFDLMSHLIEWHILGHGWTADLVGLFGHGLMARSLWLQSNSSPTT